MAKVLSMGSFTLLHYGHLFLFEQCRKLAGPEGEVIITANSDEFIERYKGQKPIMTLVERLHILASLRTIDKAIVNYGDEDAASVIDDIRPDFLIIGTDWCPPEKDYYAQLGISQDWLDERSISLLYIPRVRELSSSALKAKLLND